MSRGIGQCQLMILRVLANYEAGEEKQLGLRVEEIVHRLGLSTNKPESVQSSTRRALAKMWSRGLVEKRYYPHLQGQPRIWKITSTGLAALERRH